MSGIFTTFILRAIYYLSKFDKPNKNVYAAEAAYIPQLCVKYVCCKIEEGKRKKSNVNRAKER